jgi:hypothetical protein
MSYHEKKSIVSLAGTILIFGFYCMYVYQRFQEESMSTNETFKFWGATILILIPVSIVAKIIIHIIFSIVNTIASQEKEPGFADERDKLIELKATRNSHYVFLVGFLLALGSLVMNFTPNTMFIVLILSGFVSEVVGVISTIYHYQKGV